MYSWVPARPAALRVESQILRSIVDQVGCKCGHGVRVFSWEIILLLEYRTEAGYESSSAAPGK